mgnify:CR=1 FL=1
MLIDGGGSYNDRFDMGRHVVAPFLWHERIGTIDTVVAALVERGIAAGRLKPHGAGSTCPVETNRTEDGKLRLAVYAQNKELKDSPGCKTGAQWWGECMNNPAQ